MIINWYFFLCIPVPNLWGRRSLCPPRVSTICPGRRARWCPIPKLYAFWRKIIFSFFSVKTKFDGLKIFHTQHRHTENSCSRFLLAILLISGKFSSTRQLVFFFSYEIRFMIFGVLWTSDRLKLQNRTVHFFLLFVLSASNESINRTRKKFVCTYL